MENSQMSSYMYWWSVSKANSLVGVEIVRLFRFATVSVLQWDVIFPAALRSLLSHEFDLRLTIHT